MSKTSALRFLLIVTGISALSLCVSNVRVHAAYDAFLKIEGLDGGSKDPGHVGWIAAARIVSGDLNNDAAADRDAEITLRKAGSGGGAGKIKSNAANESVARDTATGQASGKRTHKPLVITKELDSASPKLYQACASGKHFASALVETGGKQYKLYDVVIASVQKASGGDRPMESISLNFTKIELVH